MKKRTVNVRFHTVRQVDMEALTMRIVGTMSENRGIFPNPKPSLEEVKVLLQNYLAHLNDASTARKKGAILNARTLLEASLKALGMYVKGIADGDEAKLEKSGFPLSKIPSPRGEIPAPTKLEVRFNSEGKFELYAKPPVRQYRGLIYAYTEASNPDDDPSSWVTCYSPTPRIVIDKVKAGKKYKFAVAFLGSSRTLHWALFGKELYAS